MPRSLSGGGGRRLLGRLILRFFDVALYGVELISSCNLTSAVQGGFKALKAKCRTSDKGISPLYFPANQHGPLIKFANHSLHLNQRSSPARSEGGRSSWCSRTRRI
jgi:hypothetical protein